VSLTSFIKMSDVREKIKPLRPQVQRKIPARVRVMPRTRRYMLVATAFDYFLRFELQRRDPTAVTKQWVAETAPDLIWKERFHSSMPLPLDDFNYLLESGGPEEVARRCRRLIARSKRALSGYLKQWIPTRKNQATLATHAIRLAKLDAVYRAGRLTPGLEETDPDDVADLLDMLSIVPFDELLRGRTFLNPVFGKSSELVGGADADLISGDMLVDFKATIKGIVQPQYLDQLLGYYLLARNERRTDTAFPEVKKVGIYFCRHGYLWTLETRHWTENERFAEVENWFFKQAKVVFHGGSRSDT